MCSFFNSAKYSYTSSFDNKPPTYHMTEICHLFFITHAWHILRYNHIATCDEGSLRLIHLISV